jgi:hypothetical protein
MVTTPVILSDLIKRLAPGRVEIEVVAELRTRQALTQRLRQLRPDLVIIGLRRAEPDIIVTTLLAVSPKAKFIVFSHDARTVVGYELCLTKTGLSNLSPDTVIDFIRPDKDKIGI